MRKILEPDISEDTRNVNLGVFFLLYQEELFYEYPVQTSPLLLKLSLSDLIYSSVFEFVAYLADLFFFFTVIVCFAYII